MNLAASIAEARDALQSGNARRAIDIYKELLKENPENVRLQEKFGDLLREDGQMPAAIWTYRAIANYWEEQGFFLRAVSVYQKLLKCERNDRSALTRLAVLYKRLHLFELARDQYLQLADYYRIREKGAEEIVMLNSALEMFEDDVDIRLRLARTLAEYDRGDEIVGVLKAGLDDARRSMNVEAYLRLAPKYLDAVPDDDAVRRRLELLVEADRKQPGIGNPRRAEDSAAHHAVPSAQRSIARRPFSLSSEVLLEAPRHPVADAIRSRRHGDAIEALRLLDSGPADDFPYAAMFERAAALVEIGKFDDALPHLELLSIVPVVTMQDRELIWYSLALAHEGLRQYDRARIWLEKIESTSPGQSVEIADRIARYEMRIRKTVATAAGSQESR